MGAGGNLQANALHQMSTGECNAMQHTGCTCPFALLAKQNLIPALCLIDAYAISSSLFFFFFSFLFKYHMPLDSKANDMFMGAACSCPPLLVS